MFLKNNTFLLEIYFEEIPEKFLKILSNDIYNNFLLKFKENFISFKKIECLFTNRRISLIVNNIFYKKYLNLYKIKGPNILLLFNKNKKYNNLFYKWIKKNNIDENKIKYLITDKGIWIYYIKYNVFNNIKNILLKITKDFLKNIFNKYKIMRWNNENNYFIRPIRHIILLFNNEIIHGNFLNINFDRITQANRFIKHSIISINDAINYKNIIKKNGKIIINYKIRKNIILKYLLKIEKKLNGKIILNKNVLNKLILLTEWPKILYIKINKNLLIDKNILIPIIYNYYNYLLIYSNKKLLPYFIFISNMYNNNYKLSINFHKNFIESFLKEIKFLFKLDIKLPFINNLNNLKFIIFRKNLGNLYKKIIRVKNLSFYICKKLNFNIFKKIELACLLYKCDITTNIVKEFPLLQGIAGMYYSLNNKIDKEISFSIKEQYFYKNIKSKKYCSKIFLILFLSDKIDSIIGNLYIYINEKNNNLEFKLNNDPFAIKRDINCIIYLLINNNINISIFDLIHKSINLYKFNNYDIFFLKIKKIIKNKIILFFLKQGYDKKIIDSVLLKQFENIFDINLRLKNLIYNNNYINLLIIYKRINNLLIKNNYNNFFIDIKNFSNLDKKFYSIINNFKKNINFLIKNYKYEIILYKLNILCKFINNLLNKFIIYKENKISSKNILYFLNESMSLMSSINEISIL